MTEKKPRKVGVFDPQYGGRIPYVSYKSREDYRREFRAATHAKGIVLTILILIVILGLVWTYYSHLP